MTRYGVVGPEGVTEWATSKEQAEQWAAYSPSESAVGRFDGVEIVEAN